MASAGRRHILRVLRAESFGDAIFQFITGAFALGVIGIFVFIAYLLGTRAWPAIETFGFAFLLGTTWSPSDQLFGALPFLAGTFASSVLALAFAIPIAIGTAVALAILLPRVLATPLGIVIELLAAVPSIVFGAWGLFVIVPWVRQFTEGHSARGTSILAAGIVLAVMILPIITAISRDMIRAVPQSQRDAALAMGATPWEVTWKVVLPYARPGILAAVILGLGRAIGETMAVIMVIGNVAKIPESVFDQGATMASVIANEIGELSTAADPLHAGSLIEIGLLLLAFSLALNLLARFIVAKLGKRLGVDRL